MKGKLCDCFNPKIGSGEAWKSDEGNIWGDSGVL